MPGARSVWRRRIAAVALGLLVAGAAGSSAQIPELPNLPWVLRYNAGQNLQPIFHGWARNADGSFTMHFGYLNRNYVEQLHVPVGANNSIQPGGPDQGQPTFFYSRFRNYAFSVPVPSDWGDRRLIWEVTVNGRTDQAVAWLQPEWEINPPGVGGPSPGLFDSQAADNQPPELNLEAAAPVALPNAATLVANVRDDCPRVRRTSTSRTSASRPARRRRRRCNPVPSRRKRPSTSRRSRRRSALPAASLAGCKACCTRA